MHVGVGEPKKIPRPQTNFQLILIQRKLRDDLIAKSTITDIFIFVNFVLGGVAL